MQAHLDAGKHKRAPEKKTLLDKAEREYSAKVTGERIPVPTVGFRDASSESEAVGLTSPLNMGWALGQEQNAVHTRTKEIPHGTVRHWRRAWKKGRPQRGVKRHTQSEG